MYVSDKIKRLMFLQAQISEDSNELELQENLEVKVALRELADLLEAREKADPVKYEVQMFFQSGKGLGWVEISKELFYGIFDEIGGYSGVTKLGTKIDLRKLYIEPPPTPTGVAQAPNKFSFPRQAKDGSGWTIDVKYIDFIRGRCVEEYRPSEEEVEAVLLALESSRYGPESPCAAEQAPDEESRLTMSKFASKQDYEQSTFEKWCKWTFGTWFYENETTQCSRMYSAYLLGAEQARAKLGQATDKACSAVVPDESTLSRVGDAVAEALGCCAYDFTRVWSAWSYGTMSQDDFVLIADDSDRVTEIAQAAIDAMLKGEK